MSGVIFGLYAFLLSVGYFHKQIKYLLLSGFILTFYSYLIIDILPLTKGVSWTGHLTGFIVGIIIAKYKEN
jgi:membrane associated rhomboid family serine protease